ncbi:hypothetical protein [Nocardia transvalensis]|uniref:hypothetical protein n=1 Tax=Nocardia transvalensis TaxID=37333 RepID=UPI0018961ECF|nr:hypothetical protein [Nocardia transvalensis]MBF6331466.1 hypothetical protein [Nocardia transvalensis]
MSGRRRVPTPARSEPMMPAGLALTAYAVSTVLVGVLGGGAVSALLSGHGLALVAPHSILTTLEQLTRNPADPAAAWPNDPRPGPAWLTWLCVVVVAIVWCSTLAIATSEIDRRLRRRHRDEGLAERADLRRNGLDARSATRKTRLEYPKLVAQHSSRRIRVWGKRR